MAHNTQGIFKKLGLVFHDRSRHFVLSPLCPEAGPTLELEVHGLVLGSGAQEVGHHEVESLHRALGYDGQSERQVKQHNAERSAPLNDGRGF